MKRKPATSQNAERTASKRPRGETAKSPRQAKNSPNQRRGRHQAPLLAEPERLQKFLATRGLGSRRQIEGWITAGRVLVNGKVAELGQRVQGDERFTLDGKPLRLNINIDRRKRILMYHKPVGELCTQSDPEGRRTVFDSLPKLRNERWVMIGRLDINTSGLLLLTTDGELAHRCMHPSYEIDRYYAVRVLGEVDDEVLETLRNGVMLDDGIAKFDSITDEGGEGANHWYHVSLREGRNREVRRLWESQGLTVSRLTRISYGSIELPRGLPRGKYRDADEAPARALYEMVNLPFPGIGTDGKGRTIRSGSGRSGSGPQRSGAWSRRK